MSGYHGRHRDHDNATASKTDRLVDGELDRDPQDADNDPAGQQAADASAASRPSPVNGSRTRPA